MTPADVDRRVKAVLRHKDSALRYNEAHELFRALLCAIATNKCQSPSNCAAIALRVEETSESAPAVDSRPGKKRGVKGNQD